MRYTNRMNLPLPLVNAVKADEYDGPRSNKKFSVSTVLAPPRQVALERMHADDIVEDVSDRLWALMGKSIHQILEKADATAITEERLEAVVPYSPGYVLSGKFDRLALLDTEEGYVLQDYKVTSVWSHIYGDGLDNERQLNLYRWLCQRNGYRVDRIENVLLFRDWQLRRFKQEKDYPPQVVVTPRPIWDAGETLSFITERITDLTVALSQSKQSNLPMCTAEETWERPTVYAVMKNGRKSAINGGLHETVESAQEMLSTLDDEHYLEVRRGERPRCENYCSVSTFCTQFRNTF